jgi:hypothetical protein
MPKWELLGAFAAIGVLLMASAPAQTAPPSPDVAQSANTQEQRPPIAVRDLCQDDIAKFCADAAGPQLLKGCMQSNATQLKAACRSALETAGMMSK